ncbi:hypothetical protein [Moraxella lacunata]|uniref:hypothetical protein n=1 Tax=Moraxella lacunata TaxID=477 RepID=UPI001E549C0C|nr:hypothetical protein [Moraxella lacunata]
MLAVYAGLDITPLWADKAETLGTSGINKLYFDTAKMNLVNYKNALMPNGRDGVEYHHDKGVASGHSCRQWGLYRPRPSDYLCHARQWWRMARANAHHACGTC